MGRMLACLFDWFAFYEVAVIGIQSFYYLHGDGSKDANCRCNSDWVVE